MDEVGNEINLTITFGGSLSLFYSLIYMSSSSSSSILLLNMSFMCLA